MSGDSDNSSTNRMLHALFGVIIMKFVADSDVLLDTSARNLPAIWVKGGDSGDILRPCVFPREPGVRHNRLVLLRAHWSAGCWMLGHCRCLSAGTWGGLVRVVQPASCMCSWLGLSPSLCRRQLLK